jgi:hypothetical protein
MPAAKYSHRPAAAREPLARAQKRPPPGSLNAAGPGDFWNWRGGFRNGFRGFRNHPGNKRRAPDRAVRGLPGAGCPDCWPPRPAGQQAPRRQRGRPVSARKLDAHARIAARPPRLPGSTGFPQGSSDARRRSLPAHAGPLSVESRELRTLAGVTRLLERWHSAPAGPDAPRGRIDRRELPARLVRPSLGREQQPADVREQANLPAKHPATRWRCATCVRRSTRLPTRSQGCTASGAAASTGPTAGQRWPAPE